MTDPIRWDDPASLELFNTVTGETAPVVMYCPDNWPDNQGDYSVRCEPQDCSQWFGADGQPIVAIWRENYPNWIIRNKPPQPCCDAAKELAVFKREVSEAVKALLGGTEFHLSRHQVGEALDRFIQPEPVDPIEEAVQRALVGREFLTEHGKTAWANGYREALTAITEGEAK